MPSSQRVRSRRREAAPPNLLHTRMVRRQRYESPRVSREMWIVGSGFVALALGFLIVQHMASL